MVSEIRMEDIGRLKGEICEVLKKDREECIEDVIEKQGEVYYVKGEMNEKEQNFEKSRKELFLYNDFCLKSF